MSRTGPPGGSSARPGAHIVGRLIAQASEQRAQHDIIAAIASYRRVLAIDARNFTALVNLGALLKESGQRKEAEALYRRAIAVRPERPEPHYNLAELLRLMDRHEEALTFSEAALARQPDHLSARFSRMIILRHLRRFDEAKAACIELLERAPDDIGALYQRLKMAQHRGDFADAALAHRQLGEVLPRIVPQWQSIQVLANIAYVQLFAPWTPQISRLLSARISELLQTRHQRQALKPLRPQPVAGRRLRIGYISPNWGNHPVGHVTRSFFARHDPAAVEVFGYSAKDRAQDRGSFNAEITRSFHHHVDLTGLAPHQAAARIARDRIDVLVDVDGFMDMVAPHVMAHRPAPVQVFWLGHAGGLGLPFIDYLIADHRVVPDAEAGDYREAVVRLPGVYHPADRHPIGPAGADRAGEGLPADATVFCAFNNPQKIDQAVFAAWMRILRGVPNSVLWLTNHVRNGDPKPGLRAAAAAADVDPARLVFANHVADKAAHLARHRCADLFLDTFAMNAATTALDALSVGLPVLTRPGTRFGERMAASFLVELECRELICDSIGHYVARAIELAGDRGQLSQVARRLAAAIAAGRLFDPAPLARNLERAYAEMVDRAARGLEPAAFDLPSA